MEPRFSWPLPLMEPGADSPRCDWARLICEELFTQLQNKLPGTRDLNQIGLDDIREIVVAVRGRLYREANEMNCEPRELATTMVTAIVGPQIAHFVQIGDGAIVAAQDDGYSVVFWPDSGEYANMTRFVSDADVFEHLHHEVRNAPDELALFTDGIQRLALVFANRTAHSPFFAQCSIISVRPPPKQYTTFLRN